VETHIFSIIDASKQLIAVQDEKGIVEILLQFSMALTGAAGASFVPLDDLGFPLAAIRVGDFPNSIPDAWLEYLASPSVRMKCSQCNHVGQLVDSCQLMSGPFSAYSGIYCLSVRYADHDLGILNLFAPDSDLKVNEGRDFLLHLVDIAALAIANDRLKRRELAMFDQFRSIKNNADLTILENQGNISSYVEDKLLEVEYKAQIDERARLAREIHDGLAQTLSFLKLQAAQLVNHIEKNKYDRLKEISHSIYDALAEAYLDTREAINMLRIVPGEPKDARIGNWLRRIAEEYGENTDIQIDINEFSVETSLPNEVQLQMIRIIQEALINVRKHARAHKVQIICRQMDQKLIIEIQDDGQGFCLDDVPAITQHGMRGMRERAILIGAEIQWISQPGCGTIVRFDLPLQNEWMV
jgi:signal transduction histidine kinase